eukprot:2414169-Rhodomonas_salina.1
MPCPPRTVLPLHEASLSRSVVSGLMSTAENHTYNPFTPAQGGGGKRPYPRCTRTHNHPVLPTSHSATRAVLQTLST